MKMLIGAVLALSLPYAAYAASCPESYGDGTVAGVAIAPNSVRYWAQDAQLGGFGYFTSDGNWYPFLVASTDSLAPSHNTVDMAYAINGTMTFYNVVVPSAGTYKIKFRYAFDYGFFPGVTDRAEEIKVNGVIADSNMHFIITHSFDTIFCHSAINVHLDAGRNDIQMHNISQHGVSRVDDMTVAPTTNPITPVSGSPAPSKALECNSLP